MPFIESKRFIDGARVSEIPGVTYPQQTIINGFSASKTEDIFMINYRILSSPNVINE